MSILIMTLILATGLQPRATARGLRAFFAVITREESLPRGPNLGGTPVTA
jgi:hypothetical protein